MCKLLFAVGLALSVPATAQPLTQPAKLGLCVGCHGVDGRSTAPGTPHLAAQDETYLRRALMDFRSGTRVSNPMTAIAGALQPRDIEQLAAWYAAQPGAQPR